MEVKILRFADNGSATMSVLQINGVSKCFGIEDEERAEKVAGETRVPEGKYQLSLRAEGGYHGRELERYKNKPGFHKGMLCVHNAPGWRIITEKMSFQYILIHSGNTEKHTEGCYLPNTTASFSSFSGGASRAAYEEIYPIIAGAIESGEKVTIEYVDIEKGK